MLWPEGTAGPDLPRRSPGHSSFFSLVAQGHRTHAWAPVLPEQGTATLRGRGSLKPGCGRLLSPPAGGPSVDRHTGPGGLGAWVASAGVGDCWESTAWPPCVPALSPGPQGHGASAHHVRGTLPFGGTGWQAHREQSHICLHGWKGQPGHGCWEDPAAQHRKPAQCPKPLEVGQSVSQPG